MKQTQRHDAIIELVKQQGYVSTEELVEQFSVSPQTIRRDLNDLADQNKILRHHGGAALPSSSVNTSWHESQINADGGKRAHCPQGSRTDPERCNTVYRYWHHAGSRRPCAAGTQRSAHCDQQPERREYSDEERGFPRDPRGRRTAQPRRRHCW